MAGRYRRQDALHRARQSVVERLLRIVQLEAAGRVAERRDFLLVEGGAGPGGTLAGSLQHHPSPLFARLPIVGYVWHCNRHTFCSRLAMAGATTKEIQEAAGHKTIVTAARYSHLSPQHTQSVVDRISSTASSKHEIPIAIKTATNMK